MLCLCKCQSFSVKISERSHSDFQVIGLGAGNDFPWASWAGAASSPVHLPLTHPFFLSPKYFQVPATKVSTLRDWYIVVIAEGWCK